jgi:hypothetical protein
MACQNKAYVLINFGLCDEYKAEKTAMKISHIHADTHSDKQEVDIRFVQIGIRLYDMPKTRSVLKF